MRKCKYPSEIREAWRIWKRKWRQENPEKDKAITRRAIRKRRLQLLEEKKKLMEAGKK